MMQSQNSIFPRVPSLLLLLTYLLASGNCDIYLHNPRGSNNRLSESSRARENANRLFDSQNNRRGGYNTGRLYYHVGSVLPVQWTNQHSCGSAGNNHCDIVLQVACDGRMRDGVTTKRVPLDPSRCRNSNCDEDFEFGLHESYQHYLACSRRRRNGGLFLAGQRLRGHSATFTRQNPNGERFGYECPEERDYYPYWGHSPWRDVAIFTNDASRCEWYRASSQNVKQRGQCHLPAAVLLANPGIVLPNTPDECRKLRAGNSTAEWSVQPSWDIPPPVCRQAENTRDNHLGDTTLGRPYTFNWTVPEYAANKQCALRVRYNISTGDYNRWSTFAGQENEVKLGPADRGFQLRNNPQVQVFADAPRFKLQLQVNVQQFGRVFQDRSHVFEVRPKPKGIGDGQTLHNVNVRGMRGNIVQVFPSVEYDFVPSRLHARQNDWLHLHWTGSNLNNRNNDGQGLAGTDRSNLVPLLGNDMASNYAELLLPGNNASCFSPSDAVTMATLRPKPQFGGSMSLLNDAGTNFDLGVRQLSRKGTCAYASSRNNNFSNRSHKWLLSVDDRLTATLFVDSQEAEFVLFGNRLVVKVPANAFKDASYLEVSLSNSSWRGQLPSSGDTWFTEFLQLHAAAGAFSSALRITMATKLVARDAHDVQVYSREAGPATPGIAVHSPMLVAANTVTFAAARPGLFGVRGYRTAPFSIVLPLLATLFVLLLLAAACGAVLLHRRRPGIFREKFRALTRSCTKQV